MYAPNKITGGDIDARMATLLADIRTARNAAMPELVREYCVRYYVCACWIDPDEADKRACGLPYSLRQAAILEALWICGYTPCPTPLIFY